MTTFCLGQPVLRGWWCPLEPVAKHVAWLLLQGATTARLNGCEPGREPFWCETSRETNPPTEIVKFSRRWSRPQLWLIFGLKRYIHICNYLHFSVWVLQTNLFWLRWFLEEKRTTTRGGLKLSIVFLPLEVLELMSGPNTFAAKKEPPCSGEPYYIVFKFKGVWKKYVEFSWIFKVDTHSAVLNVWSGHHKKHPGHPGRICCLYSWCIYMYICAMV